MKVCEFAKPTGRRCDDKYSVKVLCEKDNVIRCLKDCMPGCPAYRAKEEPVVGSATRVAQKTVNVSQSASSGHSGGCCGGTGSKNLTNDGGGRNISYG